MTTAHTCCGIEFTGEEEFTRHLVKDHKEQRKPAGSCCNVNFYTEEALQEHMREHHAVRR